MTDEKSYPNMAAQRATGDWNPGWDLLKELDPDYLEAFLGFRAVPQRNGPLEQKYKEMILSPSTRRRPICTGPGCAATFRMPCAPGPRRPKSWK